jgi:hypothetical protein
MARSGGGGNLSPTMREKVANIENANFTAGLRS